MGLVLRFLFLHVIPWYVLPPQPDSDLLQDTQPLVNTCPSQVYGAGLPPGIKEGGDRECAL